MPLPARGEELTTNQQVASFSLYRETVILEHMKQAGDYICRNNVYNNNVKLLCRGSLLPTGV